MQNIYKNIAYIDQLGIYPHTHELQSVTGRTGTIPDGNVILFGANDYLGLSQNEQIIEATKAGLTKYGFGACAARMAGGCFDVLTKFETELGQFVGKEDSVTFASGCQTNFAMIPALCNMLQLDTEHSFIEPTTCFVDQFAHGSLFDAVRAANVPSKIFPHSHIAALARALRRSETRRKLIIVDGFYSAEGDLTPLPELLNLAEQYDAIVYLDDAHGVGCLGRNLGGTADVFDVASHPNLIIAGALTKTFGGMGGFVAGTKQFCRWARVAARPSLFSNSLPPAMLCGFLAGLEVMRTDGLRLQTQMIHNIRSTRNGLEHLGLEILGSDTTPIIPVIIGDEKLSLQISDEFLKEGIMAPAFRFPAVPKGRARIRLSVTASHTKEQIEHLVRALHTVMTNWNLAKSQQLGVAA